MESIFCQYCIDVIAKAGAAGFVQTFRLFQDGSLFLPILQKIYQLHEISVTINSCTSCNITIYLIATGDGFKGIFTEAWHE